MRKILIIGLSTFIIGCVTPQTTQEGKDASFYYDIGISYLNVGNNSQAIASLLKAIELNPNNPEYYNALGIAYFNVGEKEKAKEAYLKGLALNENASEIAVNLAVLLASEKNYTEAIKYLEKAINNPNYSNKDKAYYNLALIYRELGDYNKFVENLEKAIAYNKLYQDAYIVLGNFYLEEYEKTGLSKENSFWKANEIFLKAYMLGLDSPDIIFGLGKSYFLLNKKENAKYYLEKLIKKTDDKNPLKLEAKKLLEKLEAEYASVDEEPVITKKIEIKEDKIIQEKEVVKNPDIFIDKKAEEKPIESQVSQQNNPNPETVVKLQKIKEENQDIQKSLKYFYIQVGAYKSIKMTEDIINKLKKLNIQPEIEEGVLNGEKIYRVVFGKFESYKEAKEFLDKNLTPNKIEGIIKFKKE
ncbi:tetratricopeptide repeat protein [Venenivibrio stagnispumantis]|uniref:Type IV pilus biogenesis/stability protein PilW n=1 Tax=Venenivibrio stagnispumantis TaxID=407998 RepID=A0AA45WKR2_9AQUI|nr:tetratricopeptide repeat protein [Venenivibrio stagnispumantis]MCW4573167.1 tetratricopeptide repeat protein [Venenivibrio stagnispumantis]SMP08219.1 type IV pilus biogenesis/stability protein PilW [Venenivibrio stagnispumantis]